MTNSAIIRSKIYGYMVILLRTVEFVRSNQMLPFSFCCFINFFFFEPRTKIATLKVKMKE